MPSWRVVTGCSDEEVISAMRSSIRLPFVNWLAPPFGGAMVFVAGSSVALATTLTAGGWSGCRTIARRKPDMRGAGRHAHRTWQHELPDAEVEPYIAVDPTIP